MNISRFALTVCCSAPAFAVVPITAFGRIRTANYYACGRAWFIRRGAAESVNRCFLTWNSSVLDNALARDKSQEFRLVDLITGKSLEGLFTCYLRIWWRETVIIQALGPTNAVPVGGGFQRRMVRKDPNQ